MRAVPFYMMLITIFIIGLSGITAQVILLRELLIVFYGNELTIGIILANWLISGALGVYLVGKWVEKSSRSASIFVVLQIVFASGLALALYFSRTFKAILGISTGEALSLSWVFLISLIILLPVSFCHGGLFSSAAKIYSQTKKTNAIGKVYAWETLGTIAGGFLLTYFFIPFLDSFAIVFMLAVINLLVCFVIFLKERKLKRVLLAFWVVSVFLLFNSEKIQDYTLSLQFKQGKVKEYRNSPYGNICVTKQLGQYTFFYNGLPTITIPQPNKQFVEEFANFPLLFHPKPKNILVVGGGSGGILNEIFKHDVSRVDYVELDGLLITLLRKYPTELTASEFSNPKLHIINTDARVYLRNTGRKYDVIIIGLPGPSDLTSNRVFTEEFFRICKSKLSSREGIVALWMPGSFTYLSRQLLDLNSGVLNALKSNFSNTRIIPGDYNIFLSSDSELITAMNSATISGKLNERHIKTYLLVPAYLDYKLDKKRENQLIADLLLNQGKALSVVNRDMRPISVFQSLVFWNKKFSLFIPYLSGFLYSLGMLTLTIIVLLGNVLLSFVLRGGKRRSAYCIFTTGFFNMLGALILIFMFQVSWGSLYGKIGLMISFLMTGVAIGSSQIIRRQINIKNLKAWIVGLEVLIIIFCLAIIFLIANYSPLKSISQVFFMILFFFCGVLTGAEFPLAAKVWTDSQKGTGEVSGILYGVDLLGGWIAGILGGVVFLPILGLFNTCLVIIMVKLGSLILMALSKNL